MRKEKIKTYLIQFVLFILTLFTTTLIGLSNQNIQSDSWEALSQGLYYSLTFLGILTVHEFGHYIVARLYKVRVTLPYYIPFLGLIGTMGAFIRIKSKLRTKKEIFDIGIAGPLAGFVAAVIVLYYGFTHLPPQEHIYTIHPEYEQYGLNYADYVYKEAGKDPNALLIKFEDNLLFSFFRNYVAEDPALVPNGYELMHYPFLFAGYLALFFTALNLLPIGQLDGGHILYGLIGTRLQRKVSPVIFIAFVFFGGLGIFSNDMLFPGYVPLNSFETFIEFSPLYLLFLYLIFSRVTEQRVTNLLIATVVFSIQFFLGIFMPHLQGFAGWLIFGMLLGKFLGIYHPPAEVEEPLNWPRKVLGWISLIIFILCFTPNPYSV
jgi:membrane-associated protease RseP (regulator of RpoE activity)